MLIKIRDGFIVNVSEIKQASCCGNYTHVWIGENLEQVWDEHKTLWAQIEKATVKP